MSEHIEKENVQSVRFMFSDGEHRCQAGSLLSAIITLTDSKKESNIIEDPSVASYLKERGLVEETEDHKYHCADKKYDELVDLGNRVSATIDKELESLPVAKDMTLPYSVHMLPIPKK